MVERLETGLGCGHTRNRGALTPRRISTLLDVALAASGSDRQEVCQQGSAGTHFPNARREPTWGAPRIHGELQMLGFDLSERTVSRWIQRAPRNPESAKRWLTFLRNHRELIAAMDFSPSQPSPSEYCTASLSWRTIVGAFCTSTLHERQPVVGLYSSCAKLSPTTPRTNI
jgi:hypothetical protein